MKNLKKVSNRIKEAIKNNEKIVLFGDADLDGVTSVIILGEAIEEIGGKYLPYISNREKWGYGLSREAISDIKKEAPALLVSLDCGISNFEGAKEAKKVGFEFIIIDHHKVLSKIPDVSLILDPMQEEDNYPFKKFANAGVVYRLVQEMLGDDFSKKKKRFLELAAIATVADMVPRESDNKEILDEGLKFLENPSITSLKALKEEPTENFVEKTVSLLNVTEPEGGVNVAYLFLTEEREDAAREMIEHLKERQKKRKKEIEIEEKRILEKITGKEKIIFEEGNFPSYLAGSIASRVIKEHKKPVFIYVKEGDLACGSVRAVSGQDAVEAMSCCADYLQSFGGHPVAAGFVLEVKNLTKLKKCLVDYFSKK